MKARFFTSCFSKLLFAVLLIQGMGNVFAQTQDFESSFQIVNFPDQFLPNWYGNEVRNTAARIFQVANQGRNGSRALAVQPISTFKGEIWVKVAPGIFDSPAAIFWARSVQNGSGTRAAEVFYAWGQGLDEEFEDFKILGSTSEFRNENQEFRKFVLPVPEDWKRKDELYLKLEVRYGSGTGSAARWLMDDFIFESFVPDLEPPKLVKVKGYDAKSLWIQFDEPVDPVFSVFPISYQLENLNPVSVKKLDDQVVILGFESSIEHGGNYELSVFQIPDLEGNFLSDTTVSFTFFDPTQISFKGLVINEVMAAPRADQDLPNAEYIELFHPGEYELRLENLILSNSRAQTSLGDYWLQPKQYLLLAPESQAVNFREYGAVLPVRSWPTMLNSGDRIEIRTAAGELIDRLSYVTASWGGQEFANGGYSLEVLNPFFACDNSDFLLPSRDSMRGTPGKENSVMDIRPDMELAELEKAFFVDSLHVRIAFSKPVLFPFPQSTLKFTPLLTVDSVFQVNSKEFVLVIGSSAVSNQPYVLELDQIQDCYGNFLPKAKPVVLVLPTKPILGEVIINEVLFNSRTGSPKFVEVSNPTEKFLDMKGFRLANLDASGIPGQIRVFGQEGLILPPGEFLAITNDVGQLKLDYPRSADGNFLQIASLPSYPISGGTVVLLSSEVEFERFTYSEKLHHPLLRDPKGVSLERVSSQFSASLNSSWQSASGDVGFATPGKRNSQSLVIELKGEIIQIEPEVFDPEGSNGLTFTTISYNLGELGWVGTFSIYSSGGQLVQVLAQNQILGARGVFTWTGTDSNGRKVRPGYYILVAELYEPGGRVKLFKKTLVVAMKF
jgi:hypothetical protein